jgi:hypothetical protein
VIAAAYRLAARANRELGQTGHTDAGTPDSRPSPRRRQAAPGTAGMAGPRRLC